MPALPTRCVLAASLLCALLAGCTPRAAPPYADFRHDAPTAHADSLAAALRDAGWTLGEPAAPGVLSTAPRRVDGLARTTAVLDVVPLGGRVVRVRVRAERRGWLAGRSKVYALSPGAREAVLGGLREALLARGYLPLADARRRDEEAARR